MTEETKMEGTNAQEKSEKAEEVTSSSQENSNVSAEETSASQQKTQERFVPITALLNERERRQSAERNLKNLESSIESNVIYSDSENELRSLKKEIQDYRALLLEQSEMLARSIYKDYDEVYSDFAKEAQNNPALLETVLNSRNPAVAAYQAGQNIRLAKKYGADVVGNPIRLKEAMEKEIREDERKKVLAEIQKKMSASAFERSLTPTDIAALGSSKDSSETYSEKSFGELLTLSLKRKT